MSWNYLNAPGTDTDEQRRDAVRLLVGDTDPADQQISDEEIAFALSENGDQHYRAASDVAKLIGAKYARLVDNALDSQRVNLSQRQTHYERLSRGLMRTAQRKSPGLPVAGGISESEMNATDQETDRPTPAFRTGQFRNPPRFEDTAEAE